MIARFSSKSLQWGNLCSNKSISKCNVMAHNMEWENCLMHTAICDVQITL